MAGPKKTNIPASFTSKVNHQLIPAVASGAKLNAITEWNGSIGNLITTIDDNFERLTLSFENDIIDNQVIALGQYIDFTNITHRCITSYDVGGPKTFIPGNFQEIGTPGSGGGPEVNTWFVNPAASSGDGSPQEPFTVNEAMAAAAAGDVIFFQSGTYTTDISVSKNLHFVGYSRVACIINVTNFVFDTAGGVVVLSLNNFTFNVVNSITQGTSDGFLTFRNVFGGSDNDIILKRVQFAESEIGATDITTGSFTTVTNSRINATTFTIDGTSTFDKATINADIAAAGRTLTFTSSNVAGDVNCANLNINNTVITGTKEGTTSTTVNNQAGGSEYLALGTFVPLMPFTTNGDYTNFVLSGNITINATGIVFGKFRAVEIEQAAGQTWKIDLGANITKVFGVDALDAGEYTLAEGKFMHYFMSIRSGGTGNGIHLNVLEGQEVVQTPPTLVSLTMSFDNTYADLLMSEAVWGDDVASLPVLLADLNITFAANGGTTTAWDETSVKQNDDTDEGSASALVGGETTLRIFGTITGAPDLLGVVTVTPTDGNSIFDTVGNAMLASETTSDNIAFSSPFTILGAKLEFWFDNSDISKFTLEDTDRVQAQAESGPNGFSRTAATTSTERPTLTSGEIIFDGVANLLELSSLLTESEGEFWFVCKLTDSQIRLFATADSVASQELLQINVNQPSGAVNNSVDFFQVDPTDHATLENWYADTTSLAADTGYHIINVSSDGSRYRCRIDNVEQTIVFVQGSDIGAWFDAFTVADNAKFGARSQGGSTVFSNHNELEAIYANVEVTAQERTDIFTYLNNVHPEL